MSAANNQQAPYIGPSKTEVEQWIAKMKDAIDRGSFSEAKSMIEELRPKLEEGDRNLTALLGNVTNDEQAGYGTGFTDPLPVIGAEFAACHPDLSKLRGH